MLATWLGVGAPKFCLIMLAFWSSRKSVVPGAVIELGAGAGAAAGVEVGAGAAPGNETGPVGATGISGPIGVPRPSTACCTTRPSEKVVVLLSSPGVPVGAMTSSTTDGPTLAGAVLIEFAAASSASIFAA